MYRFQESLSRDNIIFCYSGPFWQELIEEMCDIIQRKIEREASGMFAQKVVVIFIEQAQNIMNYSEERQIDKDNKEFSKGTVLLGKQDDDFFIISGNKIKKNQQEKLSVRLKRIQELDHKGLREYYKETLTRDMSLISRGAGLGLIDIARKSGKTIDFTFDVIDSEYSYFTMKVSI